MYDSIKNFAQQFIFEPVIQNAEKLKQFGRLIVCGMGGSNHATEIIKAWNPSLDITVHRDYGLPENSDDALENTLVIASSYSGTTEEAIDSFHEAIEKKLPLVAVTTGGTLLDLAQKQGIPYVQMPHDSGTEPRLALGYAASSIMKLMHQDEGLAQLREVFDLLKPGAYEEDAMRLVETLNGKAPIVYSSTRNRIIGYVWKINFNETGKIPGYNNVFPELNHNEINGFDVTDSTRPLADNVHFVFLKDNEDHPRIIKRMKVTAHMYRERGLPVEEIDIEGESRFHKIFSSIVFSYWTAYYIAKHYGRKPGGVPMVEELKKLI